MAAQKSAIPQIIIACAALGFLSSCGSTQDQRSQEAREAAVFRPEWSKAIAAATADLRSVQNPTKGCFTVKADSQGDVVQIEFHPALLPGDENMRGGRTACGLGLTYEVTVGGQIIKRTLWR